MTWEQHFAQANLARDGHLTLAEAKGGYADVASTVWFSLSGPAGLPQDIVTKVNQAVVAGMTRPEAEQRLRELGLIADGMTVAEFNALVDRERARWKPVIEQLGLVGQ